MKMKRKMFYFNKNKITSRKELHVCEIKFICLLTFVDENVFYVFLKIHQNYKIAALEFSMISNE